MVDESAHSGTAANVRPHRSRRKILALQIVVAAVIFASGIVVGSGATILLVKHRVLWIQRHKKQASTIASNIQTRYGLSNDQTAKVEDIFTKAMQGRRTIRNEMRTKFDTERAKLVSEMKTVLSAEQFEKWHIDFQKRIERYRKRHNRTGDKTK